MRLGCLGCLGTTIGLVLLLCLAGGALWAWSGLYGVPPLLPSTPGRADPVALERKLAEIGLRSSGRSPRSEPLVLSPAEVTAMVSGHLADAGLRLTSVAINLQPDRASVQGRLSLGALIQDSPMAWVASALPGNTLASPDWRSARGELPSGLARRTFREQSGRSASAGRRRSPPAAGIPARCGCRASFPAA